MRCADFYEKWKKDPNWCEKSPDSVREIDHYIETHSLLVEKGCDAGAVYKMFPARVVREVLKITDPATKERVLTNAAGMIKRGDKVASSDIKTWAGIEPPRKHGENPRDEPTMVGSDIPVASVKSVDSLRVDCLGWDESTTLCRSTSGITCDIDTRIRTGCPIRHVGEPEAEPTLEEIRRDKGLTKLGGAPLRPPEEWPYDYCMKYPETIACRESGCPALTYVRAGLHICGISQIRPENMNGKLPQGCLRAHAAKGPTEAPIPSRVAVPPKWPRAEQFTVEASRQDLAGIRQMISRHLAEDEQEAVQTCFEEGLNLIMDRIEAKVQEEAEAAE